MKFEDLQGFIKESLKNIDENLFHNEIGYVISIRDQIVMASGLLEVQMDELVVFANGDQGVVNKIDRNGTFILLLRRNNSIAEGMEVHRTKSFLSVNVNDSMMGKVLDSYGIPIDGSTIPNEGTLMLVDNEAQPMIKRASIRNQIVTGIKFIDCLTPVGYGQRQLILGNRGAGKTSIGMDIIISLKDKPNDICIYVSIGQRSSNAVEINSLLKNQGVSNVIMIVANGSDTAAERFYAPYTAMAIAEYFMMKGKNVVVFFDDLNQHATAHREISLTMKQSVGREAYPSDIFYVHAKLLERGCFMSEYEGGGSISAFPIMEIVGNDISSYIVTNVVSIVDGQIVLSKELYANGIKPAIQIGLSLSRVGGSVQSKFLKQLAGSLRLELAKHDEYEQLMRFGSDITPDVEAVLQSGNLVKKALLQPVNNPVPMWKQLLLLFGLKNKLIKHEQDLEIINSIESVKDEGAILAGDEASIRENLEKALCQK